MRVCYACVLSRVRCVCQFFNLVLMLGKTSVSDLSEHLFDLILELYNIDSHLLLSVLPQLKFKLKVHTHTHTHKATQFGFYTSWS